MDGMLTYGLIASDIDETLLRVEAPTPGERFEENLIDSQAKTLLVELLVKGFRFTAVTYNDKHKLDTRLIEPLRQTLKASGRLDAIERFTAYADGASQRYVYGADGTERRDEVFAAKNLMPAGEAALLRIILNEGIRRFFERYRDEVDLLRDYDRDLWAYPWPPPLEVQERGYGAMLVMKPIPGERHLRHKGGGAVTDGRKSVRLELKEFVEAEVEARMASAGLRYRIACGGWSSIDVTQRHINKAAAIRYELAQLQMEAGDCLYFGNELMEGGNDYSVAAEVPGIHLVAVGQRLEDLDPNLLNVFYGGHRGCLSCCHQLSKLLETYEHLRHRVDSGNGGPVIPAIRWMVLRFLEHDIAARMALVQRDHAEYRRFLDTLQATLAKQFGSALQRRPSASSAHWTIGAGLPLRES